MKQADPVSAGQTYWKKCSICKTEIRFGGSYYLCSVSTCRHKRKGFRFCSVSCWDAHLGFARHRESWAEEAVAPSREESVESSEQKAPRSVERPPLKKIVEDKSMCSDEQTGSTDVSALQLETLVVVSKIKKLIKEQSSFNTSKCFVEALTKTVAETCLKGIENAKTAQRKTVMGRDIE